MQNVNRILVAIDRSSMAGEALKRAIIIAKEHKAKLFIIYVIESPLIASPFVHSIDENALKKELIVKINKLTSHENIEYLFFMEVGSVASSIALKVKSINIDLLIIGTHGKEDISNHYFGSTTLKLIQRTRIPVLVVKNEAKENYKKMLAATNLSDYSKESIVFAQTVFPEASLKYLHAYVTVDEFQTMTYRISIDQQGQFKKELLTEAHITLEKFVEEVGEGEMALLGYTESINEDLLDYIEKDDADLLVLGSKGVGNLNSFLFGSTASYLVQKSPTDVLVYLPHISKKRSQDITIETEIKKDKEAKVTNDKNSVSPVQKDLESRKEEIMDDLETLFEENLKYTNWNVPEAPDQEIAEGLVSILAEKLNEINQRVKDGKYEEKRRDIFQ